MIKKISVLIIICLAVFTIVTCNWNSEKKAADINNHQSYLNHHDSIKYVGINACKQCHYDKYESFIRTGMGASFGIADSTKSVANINGHSLIYDDHLDFYYHPQWKEKNLFLKEFRLNENGDTVYSQTVKVDYVVGSGQHTNSHIYSRNNHLFQLPFTWYEQESKLDLPPGYENGFNVRFNRIIGLECMSCHNAMPEAFVMGSSNKFTSIPQGIDCERCHGPGEAHIKKIQSGDFTDTSNSIDYSIVNPGKLDSQLQFEICQRCHLQGNMVLKDDKSFFDFKPGMKLNSVMDVYLPKFEGEGDQFIMASHVDRFKSSKCFQQSDDYTCTSCHNPHVSVKETKIQIFNNKCISCHNAEPVCTEDPIKIKEAENNCVSCHMPASGSIDIPHVTVHDHYVRKNYSAIDTNGFGKFIGLISINNKNPSLKSKVKAYLQQYERFNEQGFLLDSALRFIYKYDPSKKDFSLWIHYLYLKKDFSEIEELTEKIGKEKLLALNTKMSYSNQDAWTCYRIGEASIKSNNIQKALIFYNRACELAPYISDFRNKLGVAFLKDNNFKDAEREFKLVLKENPSHKEGLNNLGYCYLQDFKYDESISLFKLALDQDPDYLLAWLNLANAYNQLSNTVELKKVLKEILRINPEQQMASQLLQSLS